MASEITAELSGRRRTPKNAAKAEDGKSWAELVMAGWPPLTREQRDGLWLIFAPRLANRADITPRSAA